MPLEPDPDVLLAAEAGAVPRSVDDQEERDQPVSSGRGAPQPSWAGLADQSRPVVAGAAAGSEVCRQEESSLAQEEREAAALGGGALQESVCHMPPATSEVSEPTASAGTLNGATL